MLLGMMTGLLLAISLAIGYVLNVSMTIVLTIAFAIAMSLNFFVYFYADKWVLKLYKAKLVSESQEPELHEIVGRLSKNAGLPKPKVAIVEMDAPNAFATGRNPSHAVVAVTTGAKKLLDKEELEGVLGHEMAHIKNHDMLIGTIAAMVAGVIAYVAIAGRFAAFSGDRRDGGATAFALLAVFLVPFAATLIRLGVSRTREYGADAEGSKISHKPKELASALKTLEEHAKNRPLKSGNPATSNLFIVNPFRGASVMEAFSTHPLTAKRVQKLEEIAASGNF
jgi:heat shock protein HtpX